MKEHPITTASKVRTLSFLCLAILIGVRLADDGFDGLCMAGRDVLAAESVLLTLATFDSTSKHFIYLTACYCAVIVFLSCARLFSFRWFSAYARLIYAVVLTSPHCIMSSIGAVALLCDKKSLSRNVTGIEAANGRSKTVFMLYYFSLLVFLLSLPESFAKGFPGYLALAFSLALFAILMIRSSSGGVTPDLKDDLTGQAADESDPARADEQKKQQKLSYEELYKKLCKAMEKDKLFLRENCRLDDVAREMLTNKTYLSNVVNVCSHMNYPQFMNKYRVEYAKELFDNDMSLKVSNLAEKSGFKNEVTFNMAFKLFEKISPSEWCMNRRAEVNYQKYLSKRRGQGP